MLLSDCLYKSISLCSLLWQNSSYGCNSWIMRYYYQINTLTQFLISVWNHAEFNLAVKIQGSPAVNVIVVLLCVCVRELRSHWMILRGFKPTVQLLLTGGHVRSGRRHKLACLLDVQQQADGEKWGFLPEPAGDLDPRRSSLCGSCSVKLPLPLSKLHWDPQEDLITLLTCFVWMTVQCHSAVSNFHGGWINN